MNLQDLGAIGEFVSSIFMLVTLVYLATQVTYLKRQAKMQATFNRAHGGRELMLGMANSDHLPRILQKVRENSGREVSPMLQEFCDTYGLEPEEAQRLTNWFFAWMKSQEAHFGNLTPIEQGSTDRLIQNFSSQPGFDVFWSNSAEIFNDDFVVHVNSLLEARA